MLFAVFAGPDFSRVQQYVDSGRGRIDGVEIRLDCCNMWSIPVLKDFLAIASIPVVLTLRSAEQGGKFRGSEEERRQKIRALLALGPDYFDVEASIDRTWLDTTITQHPTTKFLLSYHDMRGTSRDLDTLFANIYHPGVFAHKLALRAESTLDAMRMLDFVQRKSEQGKRVSGICLGEKGIVTRILGPIVGSYIDYCFLGETPPFPDIGQISADALHRTYRYATLRRGTPVYALLGDPVDRSVSEVTHNALLAHQGEEGVYVKLPLHIEELIPFVPFLSLLPFRGASVTMPLKEMVASVLPDPMGWGAVNTLLLRDGCWEGTNTDGPAVLSLVEEYMDVMRKRLLVLGAGGFARGIAHEAMRRGAELTIVNRAPAKAERLAQDLGVRALPWRELGSYRYDILIHCTSIGMSSEDDATPVVMEDQILPGSLVVEGVFRSTPLIALARRRGCRVITGKEIFARQAAMQFAIWQRGSVPVYEKFLLSQLQPSELLT